MELDDLSLGKLPVSPTESLGTRKLAIAPKALGAGAETVSLSRPVCPKTACNKDTNFILFMTLKVKPKYSFTHDENDSIKELLHTSIW